MSSKFWLVFTGVQFVIVNALTLGWFFTPMPDDLWTLVGRYIYFTMGWFVIGAGVALYIRTRRLEQWKEPKPAEESDWLPIPGFPDYEISYDGDVWDIKHNVLVRPRPGGGVLRFYDLYTPTGQHHLKEQDYLLRAAANAHNMKSAGRHLSR
jgi:hypothetical protein